MVQRTLVVVAGSVALLALALSDRGGDTEQSVTAEAPATTAVVGATASPTTSAPPALPATPAVSDTTAAASTAPAPAPVPAVTAKPAANPKAAAARSAPVAAAPATAAPAPTVLELGVVHPWVGLSQSRLNSLGYGQLEVDQRFGSATQAAVVRFEQVHRTAIDGRLTAAERLLLLSNAAQEYPGAPVAQPVPVAVAPARPAVKIPPPTATTVAPAPPAPLAPPAPPGPLATAATARGNAFCQGIYAEFVRQGAEPAVADEFAYVIAPRESGCWPQLVNSATDVSYSRLGLNFIGSMPRYWGNLCGVIDYRLTADLATDVRCGLAAYRALGWKPWS